MLEVELTSAIPVVGGMLAIGLALVGLGAVALTCFGCGASRLLYMTDGPGHGKR